mgnify:CR=1 FL=1
MLRSNQLSLIILLIIIGTTLYFLSGSSSNKVVKNDGEMEIDAEAESQNIMEVDSDVELSDEEELSLAQTEESNFMLGEEQSEEAMQMQGQEQEQEQGQGQGQKQNSNLDVYFQNSGETDLNRNTFGPNDNNSTGADLSAAFENPLPKDSCRDCIDFSKNKQRKYNSRDYLPQDINDEWFETDFSNAKYQVDDDKLINTDKYVVGINTVGQSLKNPSYDIRGTIPNPKMNVSPWNQSTIEPDFNLKSLI